MLTLAQNFMVNLEDLETFTKRDINAIKAIISADTESYRRLYTSVMETWKRVASFWGSTNKVGFLPDIENTRWLPFEIYGIDFNYNNWHTGNKMDIDKNWCEAAYLLQMPTTNVEPTADEWTEIRKLHRQHEFFYAYDHYCRDYVKAGDEFKTAASIAKNIEREIKAVLHPNHIGIALSKMGIEKEKK